MFTLRRPSRSVIEDFLLRQRKGILSYSELRATQGTLPRGYTIDRNRVVLGKGPETFRKATASLRNWQMFALGWVEVFPPVAAIKAGETVAVVVKHFGFWSLNACRIVYVFEDQHSFGFAYGTLVDNAERGEERFSIEWSAEDDSVSYNILAFSRPSKLPARVLRPLSRTLQRRFARDSMAAMAKAVRET